MKDLQDSIRLIVYIPSETSINIPISQIKGLKLKGFINN